MAKQKGMEYARGLLEKYGWTEGKGLGKSETGIAEPLKPKLKFDSTGIGHDHSEQFTFNWWELAFNRAASRIDVLTSDNGSDAVQTNETEDFVITTKRPWIAKLKKENSLEYGSFVKTETLTNEGKLIPTVTKHIIPEDEYVSPVAFTSNLPDDELFRICGGRTAHKAARHGHKLVGKLARVNEQEKKLSTSNMNMLDEYDGNMERVVLVDNKPSEYDQNVKRRKKKRKEDIRVKNVIVSDEVGVMAGRENNGNCIDIETFNSNVEFSHICEGVEANKKKKKRDYVVDQSSTVSENVCSVKIKKKKKIRNCDLGQSSNDSQVVHLEETRKEKKKRDCASEHSYNASEVVCLEGEKKKRNKCCLKDFSEVLVFAKNVSNTPTDSQKRKKKTNCE